MCNFTKEYDARTTSGSGFGFGSLGAELRFTTYGVKDYDTTSAGLANNTWQKIAR